MHRMVFGAKWFYPELQPLSDMIGSCRSLGRCHLKVGLCWAHLVLLIGPAQKGLPRSKTVGLLPKRKLSLLIFHCTFEIVHTRNYTCSDHRSSMFSLLKASDSQSTLFQSVANPNDHCQKTASEQPTALKSR